MAVKIEQVYWYDPNNPHGSYHESELCFQKLVGTASVQRITRADAEAKGRRPCAKCIAGLKRSAKTLIVQAAITATAAPGNNGAKPPEPAPMAKPATSELPLEFVPEIPEERFEVGKQYSLVVAENDEASVSGIAIFEGNVMLHPGKRIFACFNGGNGLGVRIAYDQIISYCAVPMELPNANIDVRDLEVASVVAE